MIMVGLASVTVGVPSSQAGLYETSHSISLHHVVRLEPIEEAASSNGAAD